MRSHYGGWYVQIIEALLQAYPHIDQPTDTPAYHAYDLKYKDTLLQHVSSLRLSFMRRSLLILTSGISSNRTGV